jgi:hypothetical protein
VLIFLRLVTVASAGGGGPASALRMLPRGGVPSAAKAPGCEARALQETAPIQAASRLALNRGNERPVVEAALCLPLDQRGTSFSARRVAVDTIELL